MTDDELLAYDRWLSACYADQPAEPDCDPEECAAQIEQSGEYFDRYIAGDR